MPECCPPCLEPIRPSGEVVAVVAFCRLGRRSLQPASRLSGLGIEPGELDLRGGHPLRRLLELLPQADLGGSEAAELVPELTCSQRTGVDARAQRRVEARGRRPSGFEPACEALCARMDPDQQLAIDRRCHRAYRQPPEGRSRSLRPLRGLIGDVHRLERPSFEIHDLRFDLAAPRLELEQYRLGRLAREPELAPRRVVAEPFPCDRRHRNTEQLLLRHDRKLADELLRLRPGEDDEASQALRASALEQLEPRTGILRENGRRA